MGTSIAVYICTHERNQELRRLLVSLREAADLVGDRASIAVVIVDDNPDGRAEVIADEVDGQFELGVTYRHSGAENISMARNMGLQSAVPLADWVGMLDDDVVVRPDWFVEHLNLQERTGAGATTGPLLLTFPDGPRWLTDEPFDRIGLHDAQEDELVLECQTGNSMIRSAFLSDNPGIRFEEDLGVVGGEDMVFYHAAIEAGLEARYSRRVAVEEREPPQRSTLRYQLSRARWMGNTEFVTDLRNRHGSRSVLFVRGAKRIARGLLRPVARMLRGQRPQLRYAMAIVSEGLGILTGVVGLRLAHR